ncbi:hypothetical protein CLCR_00647 [Cladophialophora carrionii]|uniref:Uncharacterized protein n=1 Tax=Cladophialophora carrionii TaxID=86049 RepID=A0A1C1C6I3_9EURO|nr:hypothetical protein CLCR_00647 [Cladophialophora carrionii]
MSTLHSSNPYPSQYNVHNNGHYPPGQQHEDPNQYGANDYDDYYPSRGNQHMPGNFDDGEYDEDDDLEWGPDSEGNGQYGHGQFGHSTRLPGGWDDEEEDLPGEEEHHLPRPIPSQPMRHELVRHEPDHDEAEYEGLEHYEAEDEEQEHFPPQHSLPQHHDPKLDLDWPEDASSSSPWSSHPSTLPSRQQPGPSHLEPTPQPGPSRPRPDTAIADDPTSKDNSHHTKPANNQPPKQQHIPPYQAGQNRRPFPRKAPFAAAPTASAGGPADKFRHGRAMKTFKPMSDAITDLATRFYHVSGKPKATLAFQKAEPEMKTIQSLRLKLEEQCKAADKAFESSMGGSSSHHGSAMNEQLVQDVSAIMKTIFSFKQPITNMQKHLKQVIEEMGPVDRYRLFQRENPIITKLMEQVAFTGVKLFIPSVHIG